MPRLGDIRRLFTRKKHDLPVIDLPPGIPGTPGVSGTPGSPGIPGITSPSGAAGLELAMAAERQMPIIETRPIKFGSINDPTRSKEDEGVMTLLRGMGELVDRQNQRTERLLALLEQLPSTLQSVPDYTRQNARLLEVLSNHLDHADVREEALQGALDRLTQGTTQQVDVLGLLQQQLDHNGQAAAHILEALASMPSTLSGLAESSQRSCDLLSDISRSAEVRETQFIRSLTRIQFWMIAALIFCGGCAAAALVVAVLALSR